MKQDPRLRRSWVFADGALHPKPYPQPSEEPYHRAAHHQHCDPRLNTATRWVENLNEVAVRSRATRFAEGTRQTRSWHLLCSLTRAIGIDVEVSGNSYYGYEILCELVAGEGTIRLPGAVLIVRPYPQCGLWLSRRTGPTVSCSCLDCKSRSTADYLQGKTDVPGPGCRGRL